MGNKYEAEYFERLNKKHFDKFMIEYFIFYNDYMIFMNKVFKCIEQGDEPSKNHLFLMRQKSIDLEKFGKQFRDRTIEMDKQSRSNV